MNAMDIKNKKDIKEYLLKHHKDHAEQLFIYATDNFTDKKINKEQYQYIIDEVNNIEKVVEFIESLKVE